MCLIREEHVTNQIYVLCMVILMIKGGPLQPADLHKGILLVSYSCWITNCNNVHYLSNPWQVGLRIKQYIHKWVSGLRVHHFCCSIPATILDKELMVEGMMRYWDIWSNTSRVGAKWESSLVCSVQVCDDFEIKILLQVMLLIFQIKEERNRF